VKLTIVSPQHKREYVVQWVEVHTPVGTLIIKKNHAPIILSIIAGSDFTFVLDTGEKKIIKLIRPGFLEATRTNIVAIIGQDVEL
jgi:F0F1-type ATP synthase epsilon subunit